MVGGEDCHNRLRALALSEVGEDLYGLKKRKFRSRPRCGAKQKEINGSGGSLLFGYFYLGFAKN